MPPLGPVSRRDLIKAFKALGFEGPFSGGKHQFMAKGALRVRIPNPHATEIGGGLLSRILKQANISVEEWERVS